MCWYSKNYRSVSSYSWYSVIYDWECWHVDCGPSLTSSGADIFDSASFLQSPSAEYVVDISTVLSYFESTCFLTNDDYRRSEIGSMRVSVELEMLREPCIQSRRDMDRQS